MKKLINTDILKNKIFLFLLNRYFVFFIQFFNFSFISIKLGVFNFGIYSFILLFLTYSNFATLGTEYSLNIILSSKKRNKIFNSAIYSNGLIILIIISILILFVSLLILYFDIKVFSKYSFNNYLLPTVLIAIFWNFNNYYSNLYRVYGKLFEIAFFQTLIQIALIPAIIFISSEKLLIYLVYSTLIGQGLPLLLFIIKSPLNFKLKFNKVIVSVILRRGLFLLFYNLSAGLILISSKTLVSAFYSVDDMGQFSFANGISQTAIMGFSVISFILFPKLIEKFNKKDNLSIQIFERTKSSYFYACYLAILLVIVALPFILEFFDDYAESYQAIVFLLLAKIISSTSFAHAILLISNKKELKLGFIAFVSVLFNILLGIFIRFFLDLDFKFIAFGNILTAILYAFWTIKTASKNMLWDNKITFLKIKNNIITFFPFIICLINCFTYNNLYVNCAALVLLIYLRFSEMRFIVKETKHLLTNFKL